MGCANNFALCGLFCHNGDSGEVGVCCQGYANNFVGCGLFCHNSDNGEVGVCCQDLLVRPDGSGVVRGKMYGLMGSIFVEKIVDLAIGGNFADLRVKSFEGNDMDHFWVMGDCLGCFPMKIGIAGMVAKNFANFGIANFEVANWFANFEIANFEIANFEIARWFANFEIARWFANFEIANFEIARWFANFQIANWFANGVQVG